MQALSPLSHVHWTRVMAGSALVAADNQLFTFSEWPFVTGGIKITYKSIRYLLKDLTILQLERQCAQVCNPIFTIEHSLSRSLPSISIHQLPFLFAPLCQGFLNTSSVANCSISKNYSPKTLGQTNAIDPNVTFRKSLVQVPYSANSQAWPNLLENQKGKIWEIGQDLGCHCTAFKPTLVSKFFWDCYSMIKMHSTVLGHSSWSTKDTENCVCILLAFCYQKI